MDIILASKSPRRKELMDLLDVSYRVEPSQYEENRDITLPRREQIEKLALGKAKEVFERTSGDRIVIGSDTLVYRDGKFYGKPQTEEKAKEMLKELQGVSHEVMTGLAILVEKDGEYFEHISHDISTIHIKEMSEEEIDKWIKTGEALDKAGAYAIQGKFCVFIDKMEGSYFSTIGLPVHQVYDVIKKYI